MHASAGVPTSRQLDGLYAGASKWPIDTYSLWSHSLVAWSEVLDWSSGRLVLAAICPFARPQRVPCLETGSVLGEGQDSV